jgi:DNA invertase Pin-like site-specific DNA recombinase
MQQLQFVATTPQQLRSEFKQDVRGLFNEFINSFEPKTPVELLTRTETAKLLKINLSTLYLWTKKDHLKSYGISGKVYYKRSELESALIEL